MCLDGWAMASVKVARQSKRKARAAVTHKAEMLRVGRVPAVGTLIS